MTTAWLVAIALGGVFLIWKFWQGLNLPTHKRGSPNDNPGGDPDAHAGDGGGH